MTLRCGHAVSVLRIARLYRKAAEVEMTISSALSWSQSGLGIAALATTVGFADSNKDNELKMHRLLFLDTVKM